MQKAPRLAAQSLIRQPVRVLGLRGPSTRQPGQRLLLRRNATQTPQFMPHGAINRVLLTRRTVDSAVTDLFDGIRLVIGDATRIAAAYGLCLRRSLRKATPTPTSITPTRPSTHVGIAGEIETPKTPESVDQVKGLMRLTSAPSSTKDPIATSVMASAFMQCRTVQR